MERTKESHIIKNIRSGQRECYKELVDEYSARVFSFVKSIAADYEDAQDITQEIFIKGFFSLDKYRGDSTFSTWIYRIAYNETISFLRKKHKKCALNFISNIEYNSSTSDFVYLLEEEDGVKLKIEQEEKLERLKEAILRLEPEDQFLITQFYYKSSSIKELGNITGLSESNVKIKLFRAKKKLTAFFIKLKK